MAFSQSFVCSQVIGDPSRIYFEDTSTGSDIGIVERRIYLQLYDGTYLVPSGTTTDYIVWPLAQTTFSVDILDADKAISIKVDWWGTAVPIPATGVWAFYDADLGVTGTSSVTVLADQSGNSHNLISAGGDTPELITDALNGSNAISSYGLPAIMATEDDIPDLSAGGTVIIVAKQSSADGATNSDTGGVFIGAGSQVNMQVQRGNTSTGPLTSIRGGINASTFAITGDEVTEDTFVTITLRNDGTDSYISINGGTEASATSNGSGYSATPLTLFKTLAGAQGNKQFAWGIICTRELTTEEITDIQDYLQTKYAHY